MRKLIFGGLSALLISTGSSFAVDKSNTGCGLGYMILKDAPDSVLMEVLAVTINNISGNQTFGITTGTLECKQPKKIVRDDKLFKFVTDNMDKLASDIASGKGETLDTLAELMNMADDKKNVFYKELQANFKEIYPSHTVESADVIDKIVEIAERV